MVDREAADFWLLNSDSAKWESVEWGMYWEMSGDPVQAEDAYRGAVKSGRTDAMAGLGRMLAQRGKLREAEHWYRRALDANQSSATMYELGVLLERQGRPVDAEHWYRRLVDVEPNASYAMDNIAAMLLDRGDRHGAEQWWRRAAEAQPPAPAAAANLAVLLASPEKLTENAVVNLCRYAEELVDDGRREEAVSMFRAALRVAEAAVGRDAMLTFEVRATLAQLATESRHPVAERAWRDVVADLERLAGPNDEATLVARGRLAELMVLLERGDAAAALYRDLLPRAVAVLGPQHPLTQAATAMVARD